MPSSGASKGAPTRCVRVCAGQSWRATPPRWRRFSTAPPLRTVHHCVRRSGTYRTFSSRRAASHFFVGIEPPCEEGIRSRAPSGVVAFVRIMSALERITDAGASRAHVGQVPRRRHLIVDGRIPRSAYYASAIPIPCFSLHSERHLELNEFHRCILSVARLNEM